MARGPESNYACVIAYFHKDKYKMASKNNRGKVWSDEATRTLITLWSEEAIQISLDTCTTSRQSSKVYQVILVRRKFLIFSE